MCPHSVVADFRNFLRAGTGAGLDQLTALDADLEPLFAPPPPGAKAQLRDRGDGREGLAAKAKAVDLVEIVEAAELAGGMALKGQPRVLRRHSRAVIGDDDQGGTATLDLDPHPPGPRIDRVLDELLDHRGRPLHDLAGGDLIHQRVGEPPDRASFLRAFRFCLWQSRHGFSFSDGVSWGVEWRQAAPAPSGIRKFVDNPPESTIVFP
jgi:hypothetical protein